jgi:ethanolamine utilization protein EutA
MDETILSVGIDIGTSTTQLIFSRLTLVNQSAPFTVPRIAITDREILYRSQIYFTPLLSDTVIDTQKIREIVDAEYRAAGMERAQIQTGAVIITGETARKENASEVLEALAGYAGDFVVATAGPDLESILAARGAGADQYSREHHCSVLHFDIGGGTSNMALFDGGELVATGCLNVGGRLVKFGPSGRITYCSPVLAGRFPLEIGTVPTRETLDALIAELVQALLEAAGLAPATELLSHYTTNQTIDLAGRRPVLSFSGGVADLIYTDDPPSAFAFGDLGVLLGQAIRHSPLLAGNHIRGRETIRATVVGAGNHATTLSGSTIFYHNISFPIKNLPVISLQQSEAEDDALPQILEKKLRWFQESHEPSPVAIYLPGQESPSFAQVQSLAARLVQGLKSLQQAGYPLCIVVEADMSKALGQCILPLLGSNGKLLCMDSLHAETGSYLDIGAPVAGGAALPVVIKTLIFTS